MGDSEAGNGPDRRAFLKISGLASAVVGGVGLSAFGFASGKDPKTYLGWQNEEGASEIVDHSRYEVDEATYERVGSTDRPDARVENIFARRGRFMRARRNHDGDALKDEMLAKYYADHPQDLELDTMMVEEIRPKAVADEAKYGKKYLLAVAWADAMFAVHPERIKDPPEVADFPERDDEGEPPEPVKMKDPARTSRLVKKVAHQCGSTLVGITRLNPDWVYKYPLSRRGFEDPNEPLKVPDHWEYAVVVGTPMSWDPMYANPNYGTSSDAYARSGIIATRLAAFIKALGYAARTHIPGNSYDLMVPPVAIDAGLGEQGRHGVMITPELGCNIRPAVVTTNLPLQPDKPIDFGVQDFCRHCKVCAENCPSGALPSGDKEEVRGYRRYKIDTAKCLNFWGSNLGNMGCRLCIAVCPYTRKANWLHKLAVKVTANDPTGISERALTGLHKAFYEGPDPQDYYIPSLGGKNASYRKAPWWLVTEDFVDLG